MAILQWLSELNCCSTALINFPQDRVVLVTTEPEANTKLVQQPLFRDPVAIKFPVQEEVKRAIVPFNHFESCIFDGRVFSGSAHSYTIYAYPGLERTGESH